MGIDYGKHDFAQRYYQISIIAIVTHDANVAARTKRIIRMVDGVIVESNQL
jgi:predicted ABC-type transport system involved in lysophospholipase L1 biosynthesis ATPase subunit